MFIYKFWDWIYIFFMYSKVILVGILVCVFLGSSRAYVLDDLVRKLSGYDKKWTSGINSKF